MESLAKEVSEPAVLASPTDVMIQKGREWVEPIQKKFYQNLNQAITAKAWNQAFDACGLKSIAPSPSGPKWGWTSHRLRNPKNKAPDWVKPYLSMAITNKEMLIETSQVVEIQDGRYGYLETVMITQECLICHGAVTRLSPEIHSKIKALYPKDEAVGFEDGDFRGFFWVELGKTGS